MVVRVLNSRVSPRWRRAVLSAADVAADVAAARTRLGSETTVHSLNVENFSNSATQKAGTSIAES